MIDCCSERYVILNVEKMVKGFKEIFFYGYMIISKVIKVDLKKIMVFFEMISFIDEVGVRRWYSIWYDFC